MQTRLKKVGGQSEHIEVPLVSMFGISIQLKSSNGLVENRSYFGYGEIVPTPVENVPRTL
jgi:hypothetical protein